MAISAYVGMPGHGKSYGVVENVIIPALKANRNVFSNIPMHDEYCIENYGSKTTYFEMQDVIDNPNWFTEVFVSGSIIVLDELWRLWAAGVKANNVLEQHKSFLAEHRHMVGEDGKSTEIFFVTQDLGQVSSFARALIETTYAVVNLEKAGMKNKYRVDVYHGAVTGTNPPVSKRIKEQFGTYKKEVFAAYISHTKSETGQAGDETKIDSRFRIFSGYKVKLFFGSLLIAAIVAYFGLSNLFNKGLHSESSIDKEQASEQINNPSQIPLEKLKNFSKAEIEAIKEIERINLEIEERRQKDFLGKSVRIDISFNNGIYPAITYLFNAEFSDGNVELTKTLIETLGYTVTPINNCLVKIENDVYESYAMCKEHKENESFFGGLSKDAEII